MKLALIGGGFVKHADNFHINKRLAELTEKDAPTVLFIPTASNDEEDYINEFIEVFGNLLHCRVSVLRCVSETPEEMDIMEMVDAADLIYLGGGNYLNMMEKWRERKLDEILIDALEAGTFIAGISAGAICWFKSGIRSDYEGEGYIESPGWSVINQVFCPHYNQSDRANEFHQMLFKKEVESALALEDDCALYVSDEGIELIGEPSKAWSIQVRDGEIIKLNLDSTGRVLELPSSIK
ncbi:peptidase E [Falsibacillus pallidus]|uniref:peptidase E n=1 Tax=Falsibacillus pallidus TaxID=493781 RepID=UPI003D959C7A